VSEHRLAVSALADRTAAVDRQAAHEGQVKGVAPPTLRPRVKVQHATVQGAGLIVQLTDQTGREARCDRACAGGVH
jgi:hypothetical protein